MRLRGLKTSPEIFERLGNPWLSSREQAKQYPTGRDENPDLDRYMLASRAKRRFRLGCKSEAPKLFGRDPATIRRVSKMMALNRIIGRR